MEKNNNNKLLFDGLRDYYKNSLNNPSFENDGRTITYNQFDEIYKLEYARAFLEMGVQPGDIVVICNLPTLDATFILGGLNIVGATAYPLNPNFIKTDPKKYIDDTNAKFLICLDKIYPKISEALAATHLKHILLCSLSEYSSFLYKIKTAGRRPIFNKISGVNYFTLPDFLKIGRSSTATLPIIENPNDMIACMALTSGTTGNPKVPFHTNLSMRNMVDRYPNYFPELAGKRNLILIPYQHITSLSHSLFGPMALGACNILQPLYNPKSFLKDLLKYRPNAVVASKAHYISLVENYENPKLRLPEGSLNFIEQAFCGGEAFSKTLITKINAALKYYGVSPLVIGYGETEFCGMVMLNNKLIPGTDAKILDKNGNPTRVGELGEFYVTTTSMMQGYYHDQVRTDKFFVTFPGDSRTWARSGDMAINNGTYDDGTLNADVRGRKSDSILDEETKERVYLFQMEDTIEENPNVMESEVVKMTIAGKQVAVAHIVLRDNTYDDYSQILSDINKLLQDKFGSEKYIPFAYKIRSSFDTSPISGKRETANLPYETDDYYKLNSSGDFDRISLYSDEYFNRETSFAAAKKISPYSTGSKCKGKNRRFGKK